MRKRYIFGLLIAIIVAAVFVTTRPSSSPSLATKQAPTQTKPAAFNKQQYSLTDPASLWIVVNKQRPLVPIDYAPKDLVAPGVALRQPDTKIRSIVVADMKALFAAAAANGTPMEVSSGYRSYSYQVGLYNGYVQKQGQEEADSQSARPGYSEHQTGLAADVAPAGGGCVVETCFADTPAGKWLAANAYKYGFIIRYGDGLTPTTGYSFEPWHIRYIGKPLASELHAKNILTLEEFFNLGAAPSY